MVDVVKSLDPYEYERKDEEEVVVEEETNTTDESPKTGRIKEWLEDYGPLVAVGGVGIIALISAHKRKKRAKELAEELHEFNGREIVKRLSKEDVLDLYFGLIKKLEGDYNE